MINRQWLASEANALLLAMEEDLEITVFLTRHPRLSPHVSQHCIVLTCRSTASSPRNLLARLIEAEKLRIICIKWRHKPLIPAQSKHPCDVLTIRKCFDKMRPL